MDTIISLGEAALGYAENCGVPVFPLYGTHNGQCDCGDPECISPGKHPRVRWKEEATTDSDQIRAWWEQWPNSNIGMPTGSRSSYWAVDIDPPDGDRAFEELRNSYPDLPMVPAQTTGRLGKHLFFQHHKGIRNGILAPHVDIRGDGGYVVLAPSRHITGRTYEWDDGRTFLDLGPIEAPDWLVQKATAPLPPLRLVELETAQGATNGKIHTGQRNNQIFRVARSFHVKPLPQTAALAAAREINREQCDPPLPDAEVIAIVSNAYKQPDRPDFVEAGSALARWPDRIPVDAFDAWESIRTNPRLYLWDGLVRQGGTCVVAGLMAAGKTTLMVNVVRGWALGVQVLGRDCISSRTLVIVSPKEYDNWAEMIGFWDIERERVFLIESPKAHFPRPELAADWFDGMMQHFGCQTFVLDTLFDFFGLGSGVEGNRQAMNEQTPLLAIVRERGYCGLVSGHMPKSEARAKDPRDAEEAAGMFTGWIAQHRMRMAVRRKAQGVSSIITGRGGYGDKGILEEELLSYDEETRLVSLGGLFAKHVGLAALPSVLETLAVIGGWCSLRKLCEEMDRGEKWVRPGLKEGVERGLIKTNGRPRRGCAYSLADTPDEEANLFNRGGGFDE